MRSTEDRARAAMRAIAGTVGEAPPLQLPAAMSADQATDVLSDGHDAGPWRPAPWRHDDGDAAGPRRRGRHRPRWSLLAPVAAAVTVAVVALGLITLRSLTNGGGTAPSVSARPSGTKHAGVTGPAYYAALIQAKTPYLVVGDTLTGQRIATVSAPAGVRLTGVYGTADDDLTFAVTGERSSGPQAGTAWYLLRVAIGRGDPARLAPLAVPVRKAPAGVALSPDGTRVAVALPGSPATLRVYSTGTGRLIRSWSATTAGEITAVRTTPGARQLPAMTLRWSADGRRLAFTWNASQSRELSVTEPDGNLITGSTPVPGLAQGAGENTAGPMTCDAARGWQLITVSGGVGSGQGLICAGTVATGRYACVAADTASGAMQCKYTRPNETGFVLTTENSQGGGYGRLAVASSCPGQATSGDGAYLGWASADGSVIVGSLTCAGQVRFGIFSGGHFTPLHVPPVSSLGQAGLGAAVAW